MLGHINWWGRCPACRRARPGLPVSYFVHRILLAALAIGAYVGPVAKAVAILAIWPLELLNTVIHESTHAGIARLLGWRVHVVAIGTREPWVRLRLGGTLLVIHRDFFTQGGSCLASPDAGVPSRGAIALYVAAPIVLDVVIAAARSGGPRQYLLAASSSPFS